MMREPGQLKDDLIIKADELLLTDKQVHTVFGLRIPCAILPKSYSSRKT